MAGDVVEFPLKDVAQVLGLTVQSDVLIQRWSVDSRSVQDGDLFFALRGPNHDGNAYVDEALRKGAAAAVANRQPAAPAPGEKEAGPILFVPDTLVALQK